MTQRGGIADTGGANPTRGEGVGTDAMMQPALRSGDTDASGNPGGNAPGVAPMDAGAAGVKVDTDVSHGQMLPDRTQNAPPGTAMAAGGMAGAGLLDRVPSGEDVAARLLGDPTSPALGHAPVDTLDEPDHFEPVSRDIDTGAGVGQAVTGPSVGGFGSGPGGRVTDV